MAQTPKSFNLSMTAQQVHEALLSVAGKFDKSKILTDIVVETASNSNVPSTLAVLNKFNEVDQRFDNLGNLASKDSVALGSSDVSGTLPINRGGTGGATAEAARAALDVLSSQAIQDLIDASVPEIQEVDLSTNAAKGILPVSKGGTGASTQSQARNNLGVYSQSETISQIATKICAADGYTFKGFFSTGFEINDYKQIGIADSGVFYQYVGSTLPKTVTAATLPSTDPDFVAWQPARDAFLVASAKAESQGFKLKGRFQTGFTIESILECGLSADGGIYKYVGDVANLPLAVPAGSVVDNVLFDELFFGEGGGTGAGTVVVETEDEIPTSNLVNGRRCYVIATGDEFIYVVEDGESSGQWIQISSGGGGGTSAKVIALSTNGWPDPNLYANGTELLFSDTLDEFTLVDGMWVEDGNVGDEVDVTAASHLTLVQAQSSNLRVGQYVILTDRDNALAQIKETGTVDNYGVLARGSNVIEIIPQGNLNVKHYGAKGDGTTLDTLACQYCHDLAAQQQIYGTTFPTTKLPVVYPEGGYLVDELTLGDGVHLYATGNSVVMLQNSNGNIFSAKSNVTSNEYFYNVHIEGFYLLGDSVTKAGRGIEMEGCIRSCTIEKVTTENFEHGFFLEQCWTMAVKGCSSFFSGKEGLYWDGATAAVLRDYRCDANGTHGIYVRNNKISTEVMEISGVKSQFNQLSGIRFEGIVTARLTAVFLEGNCQSATEGTNWAHLHVVGNSTYGISIGDVFINKGTNGGVGRCAVYLDKLKNTTIKQLTVQGGILDGVEISPVNESVELIEAVIATPDPARRVINNMTDGFFHEKVGFAPHKFFGRDLDPTNVLGTASLIAGRWNNGSPQYVALGVKGSVPTIQAGGSGTSSNLDVNPDAGVVRLFASADRVVDTSSNYNMADSPIPENTVMIDTSGGDRTVQLPDTSTAIGGFVGRKVRVLKKSSDTNNLTVATLGSALINGSASITLNTAYACVTIQTDGTDWFIIGRE